MNKATHISNVTADTVTTAVMQNAEMNQHDLTEAEQIQLLSCSDNDDTDPLQEDDHEDTNSLRDENDINNGNYWYAKTKLINSDSRYLLDFLDPEHLLANMRTKVCTTGINKAGIKTEAWMQVAKYGKQNGSNLSLALVEHLLDKQNVAFAIKTFSEEVETAMKNAGYHIEANFRSLIRNWYRAQDEPGLSCYERHLYEQNLRQWLLEDVRFDIFPPPGRYVKDIPIVLYEGFLIHIDRRSQLYAFTN
ncbi:unnamed protein product [Mytilus coruscus]|uniref:Uncharacterized protein n=1 Tax=Mytilus coruscus TaxID=42192 RepID=A0A6J8EMN0_MYTCO|nr:unnamed protein product [Mytilus coruscus]